MMILSHHMLFYNKSCLVIKGQIVFHFKRLTDLDFFLFLFKKNVLIHFFVPVSMLKKKKRSVFRSSVTGDFSQHVSVVRLT